MRQKPIPVIPDIIWMDIHVYVARRRAGCTVQRQTKTRVALPVAISHQAAVFPIQPGLGHIYQIVITQIKNPAIWRDFFQ